jgi:hypothetical protein
MAKNLGDGISEKQVLESLEKVRGITKPLKQVHVATQYGVVIFEGKGKLDLHSTAIAVPLPVLMNCIGQLLNQMIAPMLSQIPTASLDEPVASVTARMKALMEAAEDGKNGG